MGILVEQEIKIDRAKFQVEVWIWNDYHFPISYHPIPENKVRLEIDSKIERWVPHYRKNIK